MLPATVGSGRRAARVLGWPSTRGLLRDGDSGRDPPSGSDDLRKRRAQWREVGPAPYPGAPLAHERDPSGHVEGENVETDEQARDSAGKQRRADVVQRSGVDRKYAMRIRAAKLVECIRARVGRRLRQIGDLEAVSVHGIPDNTPRVASTTNLSIGCR